MVWRVVGLNPIRVKWKDNIREWTGLEFTKSQRAVENRDKWRKLALKSSVVPQRPLRLRDRWRWRWRVKWDFSTLTTSFCLEAGVLWAQWDGWDCTAKLYPLHRGTFWLQLCISLVWDHVAPGVCWQRQQPRLMGRSSQHPILHCPYRNDSALRWGSMVNLCPVSLTGVGKVTRQCP